MERCGFHMRLGLGLVALSCALLPACAQQDDAGSAAAGEEAAAGWQWMSSMRPPASTARRATS